MRDRVAGEVGAHQEQVVAVHQLGDRAQERARARRGSRLPIVPPRKATSRGAVAARGGHARQVVAEVAGDPVQVEARVVLGAAGRPPRGSPPGRRRRARSARRRAARRASRRAGRAVLREAPEPSSTSSPTPWRAHDAAARSRRRIRSSVRRLVVLGQAGDALEEVGAALVVEVLGRQRLGRAVRPAAGVGGEARRPRPSPSGWTSSRYGRGRASRCSREVPREPQAAEDLAPLGQVPVAEARRARRSAGSPRSRRAARGSAARRRPRRTRGTGRRGSPGSPRRRVAVHSQTSPMHLPAAARRGPGTRRAGDGPNAELVEVGRRRRRRGAPWAARSHSASVGSRAPGPAGVRVGLVGAHVAQRHAPASTGADAGRSARTSQPPSPSRSQ